MRVLKRYLGEVAALPVNYRLEFRMTRMSNGWSGGIVASRVPKNFVLDEYVKLNLSTLAESRFSLL